MFAQRAIAPDPFGITSPVSHDSHDSHGSHGSHAAGGVADGARSSVAPIPADTEDRTLWVFVAALSLHPEETGDDVDAEDEGEDEGEDEASPTAVTPV